MASSSDGTRPGGLQYTAEEMARLRNGAEIPTAAATSRGILRRTLSVAQTNLLYRKEHDATAKKVLVSGVVLLVVVYLSLGVMGAAGDGYAYCSRYAVFTPLQVAHALCEHLYNALAVTTHLFSAHSNEWILQNVPGYWAIAERAGVVGITLVCAVLLGISGMLYQNAFKNPIAGPGMLGVSSGVSLGMMILVALYGSAATTMMGMRYVLCYGLGAAILLFVIVAGRKLSGKDKPFDIVTMMLVGSILSQMLGFIVSFVTLFVMDEEDFLTYYTVSQMLTVDTSPISWIALGIACTVSLIPTYVLRYKFNALALDPEEARMLGLNYPVLRAAALVCGAVMILAAQVHVGMVSLVSLIVPFLSRSLFGCESSKQLIGNLCIGPTLLLICRDVTDLIPFVGDGLAIGSVASVVMLPLFVVVMARQMRGWE